MKLSDKYLSKWLNKEKIVKNFKIEFYYEIAWKSCYFQYSVGYLIDFRF